MIRYLYLIIFCLVASCSSENPSTKTVRDNVHGIDFIVEHVSGSALSLSEDRVYAQLANKRTLVFEGYGGKGITLKNTGESIILIEYCYGSIRKIDSVLSKSPTSGDAIAVKIQPVIAANVRVGDIMLCPE